MRFRLEDRVCEALLFALVCIGDRNVTIGITVAVDDLLWLVSYDDDQLGGSGVDQVVEDVFDERCTVHLDENLRLVVGERAEACAFARGENDCLHG